MFENLLEMLGLGNRNQEAAPFGFMPQAQGNDAYYWNRFNTSLDQNQEAQYQNWLAQQSLKQGRDLVNDQANYDMRGYWWRSLDGLTSTLR